MGNEMTFSLGHKVNITFMPVEPGTFVMGDEEDFNEYGWADKPKHEVTISKRFWLSKFPVTRIQWQYVMGYKTYEYTGGINRPIENITWKEAQTFCKKLNERFGGQLPEGYEFFLPTEAQWEYACRTGLEDGYDLDAIAWYGKCMKTRPVGMKKPNKWGLYDMLGNVWEWCYDWHNLFPRDFQQVATKRFTGWNDPVGLGEESQFGAHVIHGGHYHCKEEECNPCLRREVDCGGKSKHIGFRAAIRPVRGYSYWDEWGETAELGFALEEKENGAESALVNVEEERNMFFAVVSNAHKHNPAQWYFKIYDNPHWYKADKVIRVCFTKPEYIYYRNSDEKEDWFLSQEEKKHLMTILTKDNNSLWRDIIRYYNEQVLSLWRYQEDFDGIPEDLPIPDYTRLPDKIERK